MPLPNPYFAQDATRVHAALASLQALLAAEPELHWWALLDGAFDHGDPSPGFHPKHGINCYAVDACAGLEEVAPWMLELPEGDAAPLLKKLLRHCSGRPMLSFVASVEPPSSVKERWKDLHWARTDDGQKLLLRFADTRVLATLPDVLTGAQWVALSGGFRHWFCIRRDGQLGEDLIGRADAVAPDPFIHLASTQLTRLLDLAEPDAVIDLVADTMPDVVPPGLAPSSFHELVQRACALARRHGVEVFGDVVALSVAACLTTGQSTEDPRLEVLLRGKKWLSGKLGIHLADNAIV